MVTAQERYRRTFTQRGTSQRVVQRRIAKQEQEAKLVEKKQRVEVIQSKIDELKSKGYELTTIEGKKAYVAPTVSVAGKKYIPKEIYVDDSGRIKRIVERESFTFDTGGGDKTKKIYQSKIVTYDKEGNYTEQIYRPDREGTIRTYQTNYYDPKGEWKGRTEGGWRAEQAKERQRRSDELQAVRAVREGKIEGVEDYDAFKKGLTKEQIAKAKVLTPEAQRKEFGNIFYKTKSRLEVESKLRGVTPEQLKKSISLTSEAQKKEFGREVTLAGGMSRKEFAQKDMLGYTFQTKEQIDKTKFMPLTYFSPAVVAKMESAIQGEKTKSILSTLDIISKGDVPRDFKDISPTRETILIQTPTTKTPIVTGGLDIGKERAEKIIYKLTGADKDESRKSRAVAISGVVIGGMESIYKIPKEAAEFIPKTIEQIGTQGLKQTTKEVGKGFITLPKTIGKGLYKTLQPSTKRITTKEGLIGVEYVPEKSFMGLLKTDRDVQTYVGAVAVVGGSSLIPRLAAPILKGMVGIQAIQTIKEPSLQKTGELASFYALTQLRKIPVKPAKRVLELPQKGIKLSKYQGLTKKQIRGGLEFHHTDYVSKTGVILSKKQHKLWHSIDEGRVKITTPQLRKFYESYKITIPQQTSATISLIGLETRSGKSIVVGGKLPKSETTRLFKRIKIGTPKIEGYIRKIPEGSDIKIGSALETKTLQKGILRLGETEIVSPTRTKQLIPTAQKLIRGSLKTRSKFIEPMRMGAATERLPPSGVDVLFGIAKERKGQAIVFGSKSRDIMLARNYVIKGQKYTLDKVPRDIEIRFDNYGETQMAEVTSTTISRLRKLGKVKYKGKIYDLRSAREVSKTPYAIEAKVGGKFEKVAEFKGKGGLLEGEQVPEWVVGIEKIGKPVDLGILDLLKSV